MPELPEVETVRRDLEREVVGETIVKAQATGARTVRRYGARALTTGVKGRSIASVRRHGKYLLLDLDNEAVLVVHLRMSGMLLWSPGVPEIELPHTHVRLQFESGAVLRFVDPRTFGEVWVTSSDVPELSHVGPDAWNDLSADVLRTQLERRKSALKIALVNQEVTAGIGNIYADEICWVAKVRPERIASELSKKTVDAVFEATHEVLGAAIESRGSSLADRQYVDLYGELGDAQSGHRVYARAGEACLRCGSTIVRLPIGARSAFSCRNCQR
jgi:formamidopyrimidine-DNA glycosylase